MKEDASLILEDDMKKKLCIYIHIPFCPKRCHYCSFCSSENREDIFSAYFGALKGDICQRSPEFEGSAVTSIYFGGGTPTYPPAGYIVQVIKWLKNFFSFERDIEISIEANPATLTPRKVVQYLKCGINRFSIGLQSSNDRILRVVGRSYTFEDFVSTVELLRSHNVKNISADIMLGLPGQKLRDVKKTVGHLTDMRIPHLSAYGLKVENGTRLYDMVRGGEVALPDDDECADMYEYVYEELKYNGIYRYELSNFAALGYECRHNLSYWHREEYLGFGASAHSFVDEKRLYNYFDIDEYIRKARTNAVAGWEEVSKSDAEYEYIMLMLRLREGINLKKFKKLFGVDFMEKYKNIVDKLSDYFVISPEFIRVTDRGFYVLNSILTEFLN